MSVPLIRKMLPSRKGLLGEEAKGMYFREERLWNSGGILGSGEARREESPTGRSLQKCTSPTTFLLPGVG